MAETARPASVLGRLAGLVIAHRKLTVLAWLAVAMVGLLLAGPIAGRLTRSTALPGLRSYEAGQTIAAAYGNGGNNNAVVAEITLPSHHGVMTPGGEADLRTTLTALAENRSLRLIDYLVAADPRLVSPDGRSALVIVLEGSRGPTASEVAAGLSATAPPGVTIAASGLSDLYGTGGRGGVGVIGELVLGSIGALVVLTFIFGSLLAVVPLIVAFTSILVTFLALGAITSVAQVSQLVEYLVSLIGLGIAIDYSLLVITRWREEGEKGLSSDGAILVAMSTAGRSVALSGSIVALGLFTLIALPIPFLRSLGYAGLLIPIVTVLTTVTLLPALLSAWGVRLDRRHRHLGRRFGATLSPSGLRWSTWTRWVINRRRAVVVISLVPLGLLFVAASGLHVGELLPTSVAQSGSAASGLRTIERSGFPVGVLQPVEILVPRGGQPTALAARLRAIPGVDAVVAPTDPSWRRGGTALMDALVSAPTSSPQGRASDQAIVQTATRMAPGALVGGDGPVEDDLVHAYYTRFPLVIALVSLISAGAMAWAFRSPLLAVKALLVNLISLLAAYGSLVLIWQDGFGSGLVWGIPKTGVVLDFVPLMLYAFLFGLSMDYEVFIVSRIKEAHDSGLSTDEAVVEGLRRTGPLVTGAALILFFAFTALAAGPQVPVKIFATGMAVGILLDATIIRTLILPAAISFLGEWAWWPSPLRAHRGSMAGLGSADQLASFREPPPAGDGQQYLQSRDRHRAPAPRNHF